MRWKEIKDLFQQKCLVGGWTNPLEKYAQVKWIINFPKFRGDQHRFDVDIETISTYCLNSHVYMYWGTPKWMVYNGKPYLNGWFGGTTIFGNTQKTLSFFFCNFFPFFEEINIAWCCQCLTVCCIFWWTKWPSAKDPGKPGERRKGPWGRSTRRGNLVMVGW